MFRKAINIILALLVFMTTSGFTINHHYCGNRFFKTTIDYHTKCCKIPCKSCHDKTVYLKLANSFLSSQFHVDHIPAVTFIAFSDGLLLIPESSHPSRPVSDPSPPGRHTVLSILQNFRF